MLTDFNIAIIGGDARQLEVIRKLCEWDATIYLCGFDQLDHRFSGSTPLEYDELPFDQLDAIVLPVPGTDDTGKVEAIFSKENIVLQEEDVAQTPEHCIIFSGITNKYLNQMASQTKRTLIPLFNRDDVAIYNSIPTVEGTIMMAIQHTDFTIHSSNIVVTGIGRVGMSTARTFDALGANVSVGARKSEDLARITEMGLTPFEMKDLEHYVKDCDILINTVPAPVVSASVIANLPPNALILDLASKPGGTDFRYAEKRGVQAILALGLPGMVAPKTAGLILAKVISQLIQEQLKERGDS